MPATDNFEGGARSSRRDEDASDSPEINEAERERAVRALRESYAGGGLTSKELEEQLTAIFTARSNAELADLIARESSRPAVARLPSRGVFADLGAVERHLSPGEQIKWVGQPDPKKHFTRQDFFVVPFTLLWAGFAVFWETTAIVSGAPAFFDLFGSAFVLVGLYMTMGRFFYRSYVRRHTRYVITNRRVLSVVQRLRAETIETLPLHEIVSISTHSGAAARGSVEFGLPSPYRDTGIEFLENGNVERAGVSFSDISDPDTVADLVEHLRDQGRS